MSAPVHAGTPSKRSGPARLWFGDPHSKGDEALELLAEGDFTAVKLRLGRERACDVVMVDLMRIGGVAG